MTADKVRWGVLGCARIALNRVVPAMQPAQGVALWAIASRDGDKARAAAEQFGFTRAYGSYEALLADPDVEAVYIPLPNQLHCEWAIAALRAGKHVLCEKPIGLNAAEAREMATAAAEADRYLLEAFMYRFAPTVQETVRRLRAGEIGAVQTLHAGFTFRIADDPANVRLQKATGGGCVYDIGCYCINALRMAAGREPRRAWASLDWDARYGVDTQGAGVLDFGEGLFGTFNTGFRSPGGTYLRVTGSEGSLELPDGWFTPGAPEARLVVTRGERSETTVIRMINPYTLEVEDLSAAIRGAHPPQFGDEPLDATMRVLDACFAADRTGLFVAV
ncbi:MAG: Gfo/Idh/MocA family oxidoreductase [Chloroflexota bacterium]